MTYYVITCYQIWFFEEGWIRGPVMDDARNFDHAIEQIREYKREYKKQTDEDYPMNLGLSEIGASEPSWDDF